VCHQSSRKGDQQTIGWTSGVKLNRRNEAKSSFRRPSGPAQFLPNIRQLLRKITKEIFSKPGTFYRMSWRKGVRAVNSSDDLLLQRALRIAAELIAEHSQLYDEITTPEDWFDELLSRAETRQPAPPSEHQPNYLMA